MKQTSQHYDGALATGQLLTAHQLPYVSTKVLTGGPWFTRPEVRISTANLVWEEICEM